MYRGVGHKFVAKTIDRLRNNYVLLQERRYFACERKFPSLRANLFPRIWSAHDRLEIEEAKPWSFYFKRSGSSCSENIHDDKCVMETLNLLETAC